MLAASVADNAPAAAPNLFDPFSIALIAIAIVLIFFMFRNSRKRRKDMEDMRARIQPGAEVMTSFGMYGTLVSVDEDKNEAIIETSPGTRVRVHSQTIAKVVDETEPVEEAKADENEALLESGAIADPSIDVTDEPEPVAEPEQPAADEPKKPRSRKKPTE
jgi:preprotein translocase subunit YajC